MGNAIVKTASLGYQRDERAILRQLELAVGKGQLLLVTGANGAGKTTLLKLLAGILVPSEGVVSHAASQPDLFYLGHKHALKEQETVEAQLAFWDTLYIRVHGKGRASRLESCMKAWGLEPCRELRAGQLSAGWQRRVALARASLSGAKLWLLDEPFANMDKAACAIGWQVIRAHLGQGGSAVITSHRKPETAYIKECDVEYLAL